MKQKSAIAIDGSLKWRRLALRAALALFVGSVFAHSPAMAQGDTYSSTTNYGVWNPGSPKKCQWFVDQYNGLTPRIKAAYARRQNAEAHRLTVQRESYKAKYQQCLEGKLLPPFNVTGSISVPGQTQTYPPPQQGAVAPPAGSLTGGAAGGGARGGTTAGPGAPWKGSATLPGFTSSAGVRYNPEQLQISIGGLHSPREAEELLDQGAVDLRVRAIHARHGHGGQGGENVHDQATPDEQREERDGQPIGRASAVAAGQGQAAALLLFARRRATIART